MVTALVDLQNSRQLTQIALLKGKRWKNMPVHSRIVRCKGQTTYWDPSNLVLCFTKLETWCNANAVE